MTSKLKLQICSRILGHLSNSSAIAGRSAETLASHMKLEPFTNDAPDITLQIPLTALASMTGNTKSALLGVTYSLPRDEVVKNVSAVHSASGTQTSDSVIFHIDKNAFVKTVLEGRIGKEPHPATGQKVLIEFSSPNIAKPFHMGHLRSTVIGNFISNIHEWVGHQTVRMNYLGDWGTQFGMLKAGLDMLQTPHDSIKERPIRALYEAYVAANKASEQNPEIREKARRYFAEMELGEEHDISDWENYRKYTIENLEETYARLGITFTEYSWESNYASGSKAKTSCVEAALAKLHAAGLLHKDEEGRVVADTGLGTSVPLLRSDGSTLYLVRDVAAAIDRMNRHNCDSMTYVVATAQRDHFRYLFALLRCCGFPWASQLKHASFGTVRGMSTRKGSVVFLSDILDHARKAMLQKQRLSPNTRVTLDDNTADTADVLGVSAVVIADLIHPRLKDYTFNWDAALSAKGDTGVRLQYTHCRLCSLKHNSGISLPSQCDPTALTEPVALHLVHTLAKFDEAVLKSYEHLEANILCLYLFSLCNAINKALTELQVKNQGDLGAQRLLMFEECRSALHRGMSLLGLHPLQQM